MTKEMTRNVFVSSFIGVAALLVQVLFSVQGLATVNSPMVQSLGGGGRAGFPRESLYSNPAAVALVDNSFGFAHYGLPQIPDFNAGGREFNVGLYDGGSQHWKGGFGYSRISKAVIGTQGRQAYDDRSEFTFVTGHEIAGGVLGGLQTRYVKKHSGPESSRFVEGNVGLIFPLFSDIRGAITLENILDREDQLPRTIGVGATYGLGHGISLFGDGNRLMQGSREGERGWALGAELSLSGDFKVRGGLFEESYRALKGWSMGISWMGPRAGFEYALRTVGKGPREKTHTFGMTTAF